jgi:phenylacetate-CoA ligase
MAKLTDKIYSSSPIWAQQAMVAIYGWKWYRRRYGSEFLRLREELNFHDKWTTDQYRNYQELKLQNVIQAAWHSKYYRDLFTKAGITPDLPPFEALGRIPFLSKETLRTQAKNLLTQIPLPRGTSVFKSSGTTGTPSEIYYTPEFHAMELAVPAVRNLGWAGVDYRERRVMFGVRKVCSFEQDGPPFWRYSPAENMAYASIYHLSPKYLPYYLEFLRSYQPAIVMGYPSSLHTIAGYAVDSNDYPAPSKAILTTSETVTDSARTIIQSAWKCRIYDRYGAVEGCLFASQCEYGHYHVSPEVGIIEIINQQGQAASNGELGMVVCTGLQNTLQPLIRYQIGDMARWALDQNCECGRDMPILEGVEGRFEDICYTADGRALLRFDTVFKGIDSIREAQVVQEHIDLFTIIVVPGNGFNSHVVEQIQDNMSLHVGSVKTNIDIVDSIPRTSSGKFRAVICRLNEEEKLMVKSAQ